MLNKIRSQILSKIHAERERQDAKHEGPYNDDQLKQYHWLDLIQNEADTAATLGEEENAEEKSFQNQMIRIAALAVAAFESQKRLTERIPQKENMSIKHSAFALNSLRQLRDRYTFEEVIDAWQNLDEYESLRQRKNI